MTWLEAVLAALATYRLTILLTRDIITEPGRDWLDRHFEGRLVELFHCTWCTSMWLGAGVVVLCIFFWPVMQWVTLVLAASAVAGFLSER